MTTRLVARARVAHQRLMTDTVTITRNGTPTMNTTTGALTVSSSTIYTGKCRLRGATASGAEAREPDASDAQQSTNRYALILPYGSDASVLVGDIATIGSRVFTVLGRVKTTTITAASLLVEENPES